MADNTEEKIEELPQTPIPEGESSETADNAQIAKPKKSKKFLIIGLLIAVIGAGAGAFYVISQKKQADESAKKETEDKSKNDPIFHDLDEIIVNLNTEGKSVNFMKLKLTLQINNKENFDIIQKMLPRILDILQVYLRELRPDDVHGSIGLYRIKDEILLRINKIVYPGQVQDILFKEVLVQ